jgi:hypothetical protein
LNQLTSDVNAHSVLGKAGKQPSGLDSSHDSVGSTGMDVHDFPLHVQASCRKEIPENEAQHTSSVKSRREQTGPEQTYRYLSIGLGRREQSVGARGF